MIKKFITELYKENSSIQIDYSLEEYKVLEEELIYFKLEPYVYSLLKQNRTLDKIPTGFKDTLSIQYQSQLIQNLLIKNQTDLVLSTLEKKNISVIPLKGPLFSDKYFDDFAARSSSDIDILVRKEQVAETITCIKNLGFITEEINEEGHFHKTFSKPLPGSSIPLLIEIHWNLLKENTSNLSMDEIWNHAIPITNYQFVKELSTFYTFYFIILHAWRHNLDSLKHFLDIIQIIHKYANEIDYELLFKTARKHRTLKRVKRTLSIVYQQFPQLHHILELPFSKRYASKWQYEVIHGGKVDKRKLYLDFIDYQFNSYDSIYHRYIALFEWLLPSKFGLEAELQHDRLNYLQLYKQRGHGFLSSILSKEKQKRKG
ncbi:nucleotidyltransferase family protein [Metabacillus halosaccharovorans]|uniref:nucleotidyltransferase family protein n=1 Tax=Metabacillus halosaccharovorans TaxID=930124 RepID=UPI003736F45B